MHECVWILPSEGEATGFRFSPRLAALVQCQGQAVVLLNYCQVLTGSEHLWMASIPSCMRLVSGGESVRWFCCVLRFSSPDLTLTAWVQEYSSRVWRLCLPPHHHPRLTHLYLLSGHWWCLSQRPPSVLLFKPHYWYESQMTHTHCRPDGIYSRLLSSHFAYLVLNDLYLLSCLRTFAHVGTLIRTILSLLIGDLLTSLLLLESLTYQLHLLPVLSVLQSNWSVHEIVVCVHMCTYICVCVCMLACVYICLCVWMYVHLCMHMLMCICISLCVYTCVYICVCMLACVYVRPCVCTCVYICVCVYISMWTCMCVYMTMCAHMYI